MSRSNITNIEITEYLIIAETGITIIEYFLISIFKVCNKLPHLFDYHDNYRTILHIIK